jgi:hypothetical protein
MRAAATAVTGLFPGSTHASLIPGNRKEQEMNTIARRDRIVALVAAATLAAVGLSATISDNGETQAPEVPVPNWFLPIAEHYDHNPAITPTTDFAELHFGAPSPPVFRRDGSKAKPGPSALSTVEISGRRSG